jgi:hypothetical protein
MLMIYKKQIIYMKETNKIKICFFNGLKVGDLELTLN